MRAASDSAQMSAQTESSKQQAAAFWTCACNHGGNGDLCPICMYVRVLSIPQEGIWCSTVDGIEHQSST